MEHGVKYILSGRACTSPVHVDLSTLHTPCMARSLTLWTLIDILSVDNALSDLSINIIR